MGSTDLRPVVFVDRDGVLIENCSEYVRSWSDVEIFDQAVTAGRLLTKAGLPLVVVTNQQLVGKGIATLDAVTALNNRIIDTFRSAGVDILAGYMCPHLREDDCQCRKPRPGMLLQAATEHQIDLEKSFLVGDATTDLLAAEAAGVTGILVRTGRGVSEEPKVAGEYSSRWAVLSDFLAAASFVLGSRGV